MDYQKVSIFGHEKTAIKAVFSMVEMPGIEPGSEDALLNDATSLEPWLDSLPDESKIQNYLKAKVR